jgi:hypothetical protein
MRRRRATRNAHDGGRISPSGPVPWRLRCHAAVTGAIPIGAHVVRRGVAYHDSHTRKARVKGRPQPVDSEREPEATFAAVKPACNRALRPDRKINAHQGHFPTPLVNAGKRLTPSAGWCQLILLEGSLPCSHLGNEKASQSLPAPDVADPESVLACPPRSRPWYHPRSAIGLVRRQR